MLFRDTAFTSFYLSFPLIHILDVNIITGNSYIGQSRNYFEAVFLALLSLSGSSFESWLPKYYFEFWNLPVKYLLIYKFSEKFQRKKCSFHLLLVDETVGRFSS